MRDDISVNTEFVTKICPETIFIMKYVSKGNFPGHSKTKKIFVFEIPFYKM